MLYRQSSIPTIVLLTQHKTSSLKVIRSGIWEPSVTVGSLLASAVNVVSIVAEIL